MREACMVDAIFKMFDLDLEKFILHDFHITKVISKKTQYNDKKKSLDVQTLNCAVDSSFLKLFKLFKFVKPKAYS